MKNTEEEVEIKAVTKCAAKVVTQDSLSNKIGV